MSTKYYTRTLIVFISICSFSACITPFKLDLDFITKQNRAKAIRLFAYDNFTAVRKDTTLLTADQRNYPFVIMEHIFNNYKCIGDDPIVEESTIKMISNKYEVNGKKMLEYVPIHSLILSCKDGKKIEIRFIVESNKWLIFNIDEYPRPRYLD